MDNETKELVQTHLSLEVDEALLDIQLHRIKMRENQQLRDRALIAYKMRRR